jgi:SagB-type dehydrogenase family enzyme
MTRVRRARALTIAWQDSALVAHNYCSRRSAPVTPLIIDILDYCDQWRTPADVFATFSTTERPILRQTLRLLVEQTFLDRTMPLAADRDALDSWNTWGPAAAFFHFATKDGTYEPEHVSRKRLVSKARVDPPPPPTKSYGDTARTSLPHVNGCDGLGTVLLARRTWRRFGAAPLDTTVLATLLGLTWGVQSWAETTIGACALKTSPSGGARHPIEVYLLARRVSGISRGVYYYDPDAHDLVLVKRGLTARRLEAYLAGQSCYADAPAVFVMTAVFARMQWRYEFARAYRVVLLDAGHLCQTFCLIATSLGLAPFCTAALADTRLERDCAIDGVTESVIYACGVGQRPDDATWAPWPDTASVPRLMAPAWRRPPRVGERRRPRK